MRKTRRILQTKITSSKIAENTSDNSSIDRYQATDSINTNNETNNNNNNNGLRSPPMYPGGILFDWTRFQMSQNTDTSPLVPGIVTSRSASLNNNKNTNTPAI